MMMEPQPGGENLHSNLFPDLSDQYSFTKKSGADDIECTQRQQPASDMHSEEQNELCKQRKGKPDKPKKYYRHMTKRELESLASAFKLDQGKDRKMDLTGQHGKFLDSSDESSLSDFQDPESDEEPVKEVPVETFVKSTRIIYPNGEVEYIDTKRK